MANKGRRSHYRVAQKTIAQSPQRGIFITNNQKSRIAAIGLAGLAVSFLNGILIGHSLFKKYN